MRLRIFFFLLALVAAPVLANDLTLNDGRVLKNWRVMSVSPGFITLRYDGGAMRVQKEMLPPELLAKYPIDPVAVAAEKAQTIEGLRITEERRAEIAAREKLVEYERARAYEAARAKDKAVADREAQVKAAVEGAARDREIALLHAAELQKRKEQEESRDGLYLAAVNTNMASVVVTMKNISTSSQTFEWRQLRAKFTGGEVREPTNLVPTDRKFGYVVEPDQSRTFEVAFGVRKLGDGNWIREVSWAKDIWVEFRRTAKMTY